MASQKAPGGLPNPYGINKGLPNPYAAATISGAPVHYSEEQQKAEQQKKLTAFHNPHNIKRPQAKKAGPAVKKAVMPMSATVPAPGPTPASNTQQHGIDYYRSTADDDAAIIEERRQRDHEERQRKKEQKKFNKMFGHFNPLAPHRPDRPSNMRAYRASGGYDRKKAAFKALVMEHKQPKESGDSKDSKDSSDSNDSRPATSTGPEPAKKPSFAPPASYDNSTAPSSDQSGEDAYARRMRLSQQASSAVPSSSPPPPPAAQYNAPPPPPPAESSRAYPPPPPPPAPASTTYQGATISAPPVRYAGATISAPPVRFERPDVEMADVNDEPVHEERPAKRPKISKAEAMMAKMGYKKGQGLGKNSDGVVTHLEVKKRKVPQGGRSADEDGSGRAQQVWDVHGGMRAQQDEPGKFGEESSVVVAWGCVDGVDWGANADRNDGGIRQEMGEAFSSKFGPVERMQLDESSKDGAVYIHFKSVLSALNAVNRFDEGWEFRGRKIRAQYYDERKFHAGIYDH